MPTEALYLCDDTSPDWLDFRREGVTGTDAPAILGISPFSSPLKVASIKRGLLEDDDVESELMAWGRKIEGVTIEAFLEDMERAGRKGWTAGLSGKLFRCQIPGNEFMLSTRDGWVQAPDGKKGVVECKLKIFGWQEWEKEGVPDYVTCQTQHNAHVADADFAVVIGLLQGFRPRWKIQDRNRELLGDSIIPAEQAFWDQVHTDHAFPMDGPPDVNLGVLKRLYPQDNGKRVKLPGPELETAFKAWRLNASLRIAAEKIEKSAKAELVNAIGANTWGVLDDGTQVSNKTWTREPYQVKAGEGRTLREDSVKTTAAVAAKLGPPRAATPNDGIGHG